MEPSGNLTAGAESQSPGYLYHVCDGYPDGPARAFADESYVIPVTDTDRIAALCKEKQVDGILTSFSDLLLECMVKISAKAGLPLLSEPGTASLVSRQIRHPGTARRTRSSFSRFCKIPTTGFAPELISHLHFPLVTKTTG
mgnify:CR=1 FL=1